MNLVILFISLCFYGGSFAEYEVYDEPMSTDVPPSKVLKCAVCKALVQELHSIVKKTDQRKVIETGSYRIESDGGQIRKKIKYAGSEAHIIEILASVCELDYVFVMQHKKTRKFTVFKATTETGALQPNFEDYFMLQEEGDNMREHCKSFKGEFDEEIIRHMEEVSKFKDYDINESKHALCYEKTSGCEGPRDEL